MPTSVRLPARVEQEIAEYCTAHKITKSEAVKRALRALLDRSSGAPGPYASARRYLGADKRPGDVARQSKRLLRERLRKG